MLRADLFPAQDRAGEFDGGRGVVAGAVLAGFLDGVVLGPGALDDAGVAALPPLVQVLRVCDAGHDAGEDALALVRGKKPGRRRRMMRTVLLNLTRPGSMPALVAAVQIRALMA